MNSKIEVLLDHPVIEVDLHQAVFALTESLNLVGIDEHQHGERVAYMAIACARHLGWSAQRLDDLLHAALLHDCGVSSSKVHKQLIAKMDWEGAELHCVLGEYYLKSFPPLSHLAPVVRHHHTHWRQLQHMGLPAEDAEASNLIYLVDRVDALRAQLLTEGLSLQQMIQQVHQRIKDAAEERFAPQLLDAFMQVSDNEAFWLTLEPLNLADFITSLEGNRPHTLTSYEDVRKLARVFAHIVDAKSSFTFDHSMGVARVANHLASLLELPPRRIALIELAGLLHDLGKLGVPDEILEKTTELNAEEAAIMHRHSYETFRILSRIKGFESIAEWAGNHHETLLGDGYPFQHDGSELSIESRIIAVADIFQALAQDRPYRKALTPEQISSHLQELADAGKIDPVLVKLVADNLDTIWVAAIRGETTWIPTLHK